MPRAKEFSVESRASMVADYKNGIKVSEIAKKYNCHRNSILYQLKKKNKIGTLNTVQRKGRKRVTSKREDSTIRRIIEQNPSSSINDVVKDFNLLRPENNKISYSTIERRLKEANYKTYTMGKQFYISKKNKKIRLQFATEYFNKSLDFWKKILWTDECTVSLDGTYGKKFYRSKTGRKKDQVIYTRHSSGGKLMIWGCISYNGIGPIVELSKKVNSYEYLNIINEYAVPAGDTLIGSDFILQQDNAPIHTSKVVKDFIKEIGQNILKWPPQSPDLNVIENVWHILKSRSPQQLGRSKEETWNDINKVWDEISLEYCRTLIESIPRRLQEVIKAKGGPTSY